MIINVKSVWLDMFARLYIEMLYLFRLRHVDVKRIRSLDPLTNKTRETSTQKNLHIHMYNEKKNKRSNRELNPEPNPCEGFDITINPFDLKIRAEKVSFKVL